MKRNRAEQSCSLGNLVVQCITSAGLKLPNWKNPIAPKSLTVIGYQGEIFNVEFCLSKGRLCVIVTLERQQNKPDLLIALFKPFVAVHEVKNNHKSFSERKWSLFLLWAQVQLSAEIKKALKLPSTRKRQNHNLDKKNFRSKRKQSRKEKFSSRLRSSIVNCDI